MLRWAELFARSFAPALEVLYADWWEPPRYFTEAQIRLLTEQARAHHKTVFEQLSHLVKKTLGSDSKHSIEVIDGYPASITLERARTRQADLIVMGSHGRTGLARFRLGSVAEDVVQQSASPTLIVKHDGEPGQPPAIRQVLCPVNSRSFHSSALRCLRLLPRCLELVLRSSTPSRAPSPTSPTQKTCTSNSVRGSLERCVHSATCPKLSAEVMRPSKWSVWLRNRTRT